MGSRPSSSGKTLVMAVKVMLMSTGILTIAIFLLVLMPNLLTSATTNVPTLFSTLRGWLRPPYLYFLINAIIAAIAFLHHQHNRHAPPPSKSAAVTSHHHHETASHDVIALRADNHLQFPPYLSVAGNSEPASFRESYDYNGVVSVKDVEVEVVGKFADVVEKEKRVVDDVVVADDYDVGESTVADESTWTAPPPLMRQEALKKVLPQRPPPSSRFAQHRRPAKAPAEGGKSLRVHKPKKHDTLESTWKAITEGRHVPLNRHLKKSDTWENSVRQIDILEDPAPFSKAVKKSETFKERTNYMNTTTSPAAPTKLKKESSLGQDELNRRVEAFINKFNEDMRLQRQQSMQQFMDMINRAA